MYILKQITCWKLKYFQNPQTAIIFCKDTLSNQSLKKNIPDVQLLEENESAPKQQISKFAAIN